MDICNNFIFIKYKFIAIRDGFLITGDIYE